MTEKRLKDKVAVVTGAASGLGLEIARTFAGAGAKVMVADLDGAGAAGAADEINRSGGQAVGITMDVTDESQVEAAMDQAVASLGRLDILVSNAGIQIVAPLEELAYADWKKVLAVHLDGAFLTTRAVLRHFYRQHSGTIIYMGSVHSKEASLLKAPYITAKHGLIGLAKTVAREGAKYGVRTNVICPGFVRTPMVEKQIPEQARMLGIDEQEVVEKVMLKETVDRRFTTTDEIGAAAVYLAEQKTLALTGQSIMLTHGWFME